MDLSLRECARLIEVPEADVRRLVRERALPAYRLNDRHRIGRVDLLEWGMSRAHRISPQLFAGVDELAPDSLRRALDAGGVVPLASGGWPAALGSAKELPEDIVAVLLARLGRAFSLVHEGIAIPHPRSPLVGDVDAPRLVGGILDPPLVLPGADSAPAVWLTFVLVCPTVRPHLDLLARLAFVLHDEPLRALLRARGPLEAILARVAQVEQAALSTGRRSVVP